MVYSNWRREEKFARSCVKGADFHGGEFVMHMEPSPRPIDLHLSKSTWFWKQSGSNDTPSSKDISGSPTYYVFSGKDGLQLYISQHDNTRPRNPCLFGRKCCSSTRLAIKIERYGLWDVLDRRVRPWQVYSWIEMDEHRASNQASSRTPWSMDRHCQAVSSFV